MKKLKFLVAGGMLAIAVVAGLVFGVTAGYGGAGDAAIQAASDADLQAQRARAQALVAQLQAGGASPDGITVHGRWKIDVRDPDGSLVSSQEFDNALTQTGEEALAKILSREKIPGLWQIHVIGIPTTSGPCLDDGNNPTACIYAEADETFVSNVIQKVLVVSRPVNPGDTVVLKGNGVAQTNGEIGQVATFVQECDPAAPAICSNKLFTDTNVTPQEVVEGQSVLVVVTFSFN